MKIQGVQGYLNQGDHSIDQNMEYQNFCLVQKLPVKSMDYNQEYTNKENIQYPTQFNQTQLPTIYTKKVQIVKETTEEQVKYFEPIELKEGEDINQFLKNELMKIIGPKIMALKQEEQRKSMKNPLVHTELTFDFKQNDAIYKSQGEKEDDERQKTNSFQSSEKEQLNIFSHTHMNSNYSSGEPQSYYGMFKN